MLNSVYDVFALLGGPAKVGRILGKRVEHTSGMRRRKSIPVTYWPTLIAYAKANGIPEITWESLARVHAGCPAPAPIPAPIEERAA